MGNRIRKHQIHFMVSEEERKIIEQRMELAGMSNMRAYLLKMAMDGYILQVDFSSVHKMVRLLSNATNNINQIAKRVNETGNIYATDLSDLRRRCDEIWEQTKEILSKVATL